MQNVANTFDNEWICRYPRPHCVIFDNGPENASIFRELLERYDIVPKQTHIKNPQVNAYIERTHHTVANALRALELESKYFDPSKVHGIVQSFISCEGLLGKEAEVFLKHLLVNLTEKWHRPYSQTASFVLLFL